MLKEGSFINIKFRKLFFAYLLSWLIAVFREMVDSFLAGIFLGEAAVSAIELVEPSNNIIMFFSLLVGYGGAILYSQILGKYEKEESHVVAGNTILYALILGTISCLLLFGIKDVFLNFYGCPDDLKDYCLDYYNINIIISFISPLFWSLYELVFIDGDEKCAVASDVILALTKIILSLVLVKQLHIKGLILSTLISYILAFIPLIIHFFRKNNSIHFKFKFNLKLFGEISHLGTIASLEYLFMAIVDIVINRYIINKFGEVFLPAYTVINYIIELAVVTKTGVDAASSFITVDYGQNNNIGIKRVMKKCLSTTLPLTIISIMIILALTPLWPIMFNLEEEIVKEYAEFASTIIPLSFIFTSYLLVFSYYYAYIGKGLIGESIHFLYNLILPLLIPPLFGNLWGFKGMVIGFTIIPIITGLIVFGILFIVKKGKNLPLLLPSNDEIGKAYDLVLDEKSIVNLRDQIGKFLLKQNVEEKLSNKIQMMIEETLFTVKQKNNDKTIVSECTILINKDHIRLITKDNGIIFNIANSDNQIDSIQSYVLDEMMNHAHNHITTTTISYNRNIFIWNRKDA